MAKVNGKENNIELIFVNKSINVSFKLIMKRSTFNLDTLLSMSTSIVGKKSITLNCKSNFKSKTRIVSPFHGDEIFNYNYDKTKLDIHFLSDRNAIMVVIQFGDDYDSKTRTIALEINDGNMLDSFVKSIMSV